MASGERLRNARCCEASFLIFMVFCAAAVGCATDGGVRGGTSVERRSPPNVGVLECSAAAVDKAQTKDELLSLREHCSGSDAEGWAWQKLNRLPPPRAPKVALQPRLTNEPSDRVTLEAEVYFYVFEVYLPEQGLQRLNKLIEAVGRSYEIDSVELTGSADTNEILVGAKGLPSQRVDWIRLYLADAGIVPMVSLTTRERPPTGGSNAESRARDRSVAIKIVTKQVRRAKA